MLCVCVDRAEVFDVTRVTDRLRARKPDSGWLMLVDGRQKYNDRNFAAAAELFRNGICSLLLHPLLK